jgi:hypothetical protein
MENIIYGLKIDDKYHYIGKYSGKLNKEGKINKSDLCVTYHNKYRNIFALTENVDITTLSVADDEWYDEKIKEVVQKYGENNPLQNPQWMLEGKRGYWSDTKGYFNGDGYWKGKKRDANTLKQLSESKFKKLVQYDKDGNFVKEWDSIREVAIKVFNDYAVIKGCAKSTLYTILKSGLFKNRFRHGSYWIKSEELMNEFNCIPVRLKIDAIIKSQKKKHVIINKADYTIMEKNIYSVEHTANSETKTYMNAFEASNKLKLSVKMVRYYCRNKINGFCYGKKMKQKLTNITT